MCIVCKKQYPIAEFSIWLKPRKDKTFSRGARRDTCKHDFELEQQRMSKASTAMVMKHRITTYCKQCYELKTIDVDDL